MDASRTMNRGFLRGIWRDERNEKSRGHDCHSSSSSGWIPKAVISICAVSSTNLTRVISVIVFEVTKWFGAANAKNVRKNILFSGPSRKKIASFVSIRGSISVSCRFGSSSTSSITRCYMRLCRTRCAVMGGAACTPTNSIAANANFASTNVPDVGKMKISRVFCARRETTSPLHITAL